MEHVGDERSGPNPSTGRGTHGGPKGSGDHSLRGEIMGELFGKESVKLLLSRDTQSSSFVPVQLRDSYLDKFGKENGGRHD